MKSPIRRFPWCHNHQLWMARFWALNPMGSPGQIWIQTSWPGMQFMFHACRGLWIEKSSDRDKREKRHFSKQRQSFYGWFWKCRDSNLWNPYCQKRHWRPLPHPSCLLTMTNRETKIRHPHYIIRFLEPNFSHLGNFGKSGVRAWPKNNPQGAAHGWSN